MQTTGRKENIVVQIQKGSKFYLSILILLKKKQWLKYTNYHVRANIPKTSETNRNRRVKSLLITCLERYAYGGRANNQNERPLGPHKFRVVINYRLESYATLLIGNFMFI
jgi:hypothetical protein